MLYVATLAALAALALGVQHIRQHRRRRHFSSLFAHVLQASEARPLVK